MKILNDMIAGELDNPPSNKKISIFFHKSIYALSCQYFTTYLKYFYFDKNDVIGESEKWKEFITRHQLSDQLVLGIKKFVRRVDSCKAFL
jgi:hypothetical protein